MTWLPGNSEGLNSGPPIQSWGFSTGRVVINLAFALESLLKLLFKNQSYLYNNIQIGKQYRGAYNQKQRIPAASPQQRAWSSLLWSRPEVSFSRVWKIAQISGFQPVSSHGTHQLITKIL